MTSIGAWARWFVFAMPRQNSSPTPKPISGAATQPQATAAPSAPSLGSWRPLTASSRPHGNRYLVRRGVHSPRFTLHVYDLRTGLAWRCTFSSQYERNAYLNQLRAGATTACPDFLCVDINLTGIR